MSVPFWNPFALTTTLVARQISQTITVPTFCACDGCHSVGQGNKSTWQRWNKEVKKWMSLWICNYTEANFVLFVDYFIWWFRYKFFLVFCSYFVLRLFFLVLSLLRCFTDDALHDGCKHLRSSHCLQRARHCLYNFYFSFVVFPPLQLNQAFRICLSVTLPPLASKRLTISSWCNFWCMPLRHFPCCNLKKN